MKNDKSTWEGSSVDNWPNKNYNYNECDDILGYFCLKTFLPWKKLLPIPKNGHIMTYSNQNKNTLLLIGIDTSHFSLIKFNPMWQKKNSSRNEISDICGFCPRNPYQHEVSQFCLFNNIQISMLTGNICLSFNLTLRGTTLIYTYTIHNTHQQYREIDLFSIDYWSEKMGNEDLG